MILTRKVIRKMIMKQMHEATDVSDQNLAAIKSALDSEDRDEFLRLYNHYSVDPRYADSRILPELERVARDKGWFDAPEEEWTSGIEPEQKVYDYPGDSIYEYKVEDDVWYTRKQAVGIAGVGDWIRLSDPRYAETNVRLDGAHPSARSSWAQQGSASAAAPPEQIVEPEPTPGGQTIGMGEPNTVTDDWGHTWEKVGNVWQADNQQFMHEDGEERQESRVMISADGGIVHVPPGQDPDDPDTWEPKQGMALSLDMSELPTYEWLENPSSATPYRTSEEPLEGEFQTSEQPLEESLSDRWGTLAGILKG